MSVAARRITFAIMFSIILAATVRYAIEFRNTEKYMQGAGTSKFLKHRSPNSLHAKASGFFQVESNLEFAADSRILVLNVKANQNVRTAELRWHLPKSAKILEGEELLSIRNFNRGETRRFEIQVAGLNGKPAFAEVSTLVNGVKFGATAPFSDNPAKTILNFGNVNALESSARPKLIQ